MDATTCVQPFVFGAQEGASRAALLAASSPARVAGLILYAGYARVTNTEDFSYGQPPEFMQTLLASVEDTWGNDFGMQLVAPTASRETRDGLARRARAALGPGDALAMMRFTSELDIRAVLPTISSPTLILHRTNDHIVPVTQSRYLAEQMPNARLIELSGENSTAWIDADMLLDEVEAFVTGTRPMPVATRLLTTVLFTDIVGSTERVGELGDRAWRDLLETHHAEVRRQLRHFGGREIDTAGDGFLAAFDGPARAVRCAIAIRNGVQSLGLHIRAGVHTGEVELHADTIAGIAVHIGARVAALADADEVLVTSTVKDLVLGSGIVFGEERTEVLRGVLGEWRLFSIAS